MVADQPRKHRQHEHGKENEKPDDRRALGRLQLAAESHDQRRESVDEDDEERNDTERVSGKTSCRRRESAQFRHHGYLTRGPAAAVSPRMTDRDLNQPDVWKDADTRNVTVHEAYPGHHLQLSVAAQKASLAAFLCEVPDLSEGWALYCEAIMGAHGYTAKPEERLIRARDARWRAVRIVLDVELHLGRLTPEQATARLADETGMGREEAAAEVLRYTQAPAYNLSYMWGRLRIEELRARVLGAGVSERAFHDAFLSIGTLPVDLVATETQRRLGLSP